MLGKLLLILIGVFAVSAIVDVFEGDPGFEPWYLADAQKTMKDDHVVHAIKKGDAMTFETPLMERQMALSLAETGNVIPNALTLGYRTFIISNGLRTWTYDLEKRVMTP